MRYAKGYDSLLLTDIHGLYIMYKALLVALWKTTGCDSPSRKSEPNENRARLKPKFDDKSLKWHVRHHSFLFVCACLRRRTFNDVAQCFRFFFSS